MEFLSQTSLGYLEMGITLGKQGKLVLLKIDMPFYISESKQLPVFDYFRREAYTSYKQY